MVAPGDHATRDERRIDVCFTTHMYQRVSRRALRTVYHAETLARDNAAMAITVLGAVLVGAGVMLAGILAVAFRTRGSRQQVGSGSGGDASWLPAVMSGDGNDGCAAGDAGCDGGGGGGD